ncbi:DinB family protein [Loktanella sp. 3ANDIMAR09]|uniref:DinB family protein n=1 Tax=Loktanella sp. 3ANDIMAR09 TaxID=1225657 RepID=UPI0006FB644E|nr:DinB family protein [Loktanella sp. 3ANDIMAR09]
MIDRAYCRMMARYNAWQNKALWDVFQKMSDADLAARTASPHGSVLGAVNHLLWLDRMWLSRLYAIKPPAQDLSESTTLTPDIRAWWLDRFRTDGALRMWADTLNSVDLLEQIAFWSISLEQDIILQKDACVMHMFNQQTDQRAVIRTHLAAMGHALPSVNLFETPPA